MSSEDVLEYVKIFKKKIIKYSEESNDEKLLSYLNKLNNTSVTVKHLEDTNIGITVNALAKASGSVGTLCSTIIVKWKAMVHKEVEEEKQRLAEEARLEKEMHKKAQERTPTPVTESDSDSENGLRIEESRESKDEDHYNIYQEKNDDDTDSQNGYNPLTSRQDYMNVGQSIPNPNYSPTKFPQQEKDSSLSPHREHYSSIDNTSSKSESISKDNDSHKSKRHKDHKHKSKDEKSKNRNKEDKHKSSKEKDRNKDRHKHKEDKHKGKDERSKDKSKHREDKNKIKEKVNEKGKKNVGLTEVPLFDFVIEESPRKVKISKHLSEKVKHKNKEHKHKKSKTEEKDSRSKSKSESSSSHSSKKHRKDHSESSSNHDPIQSSHHLKNTPDSNYASSKSKKRTSNNLENTQHSSKKKKLVKDFTNGSATEPVLPQPCLLSSYKPLPKVPDKSLSKDLQKNQNNSEEGLNFMFSLKKTRQKTMYNPTGSSFSISSLSEMCIKVVLENLDVLRGKSFAEAEPVLERVTPQQLDEIEYFNPHLLEDTSHIWESHCRRLFKNQIREEMETWREMFHRCTIEYKEKFDNVTKKILQKNQVKPTEVKRTTQLAYITPHVQSRSLSRAKVTAACPAEQAQFSKKETYPVPPSAAPAFVSKPERPIQRPPPAKARKIPPLMAKSRQLLKIVRRR